MQEVHASCTGAKWRCFDCKKVLLENFDRELVPLRAKREALGTKQATEALGDGAVEGADDRAGDDPRGARRDGASGAARRHDVAGAGPAGGRRAAIAVAVLALAACTRPAPDASPEGAVRAWLDRMEASDEDAHAIRDAYALLGPAARANLEERAERASRLEGHHVEPWDMLAEGRFGLKFRPKAMVSRASGDEATVAVTGDEPLTEHATVHCARVAGPPIAWRIEPELPPVPPLPRRDPDPSAPRTEAH